MNNFFKYVAILGLISAGLACEKKSSNTEPQTGAPSAELSQVPTDSLAASETVIDPQSNLVPSGRSVMTSSVIAHESGVGELPAEHDSMSWDEVIMMYPRLSERVGFLASIDHVVETDARTIDLYSGGALVMTLAYNTAGDALAVRSVNHAGFVADLITFESSAAEQSQGSIVETLDFVMSSCDVAKQEQPQEQEQSQTGKEAPVKEEPKQEQEQSQTGKEAPVKEEPKQVCASIVVRLVLQQVVEKQEQQQEMKEEPKQEMKEEPKAPEQEQKQEPKAPVQQEQKQN